MKLTKKEIGLIGMGFFVAAISVLAMIGATWLTVEINHQLDRGYFDAVLFAIVIAIFVGLGCLYSTVFITQKKVVKEWKSKL